jgi:DNA-binding MarR family transcriptional regulator
LSECELPPALEDHAHSDKLVYRVLDAEGPMTVADLRESAYLADSTARLCLDRLADADLVTESFGPDARVRYYDTTR